MVVSGAVERPILGILQDPTDPQSAVDLCDCPLYPQRFAELFPILKDFIGRAGLVPYNVAKQKGEQTVRETLPEGFQRAEFLLEKGAIDQIVDRRSMKKRISDLITLLRHESKVTAA